MLTKSEIFKKLIDILCKRFIYLTPQEIKLKARLEKDLYLNDIDKMWFLMDVEDQLQFPEFNDDIIIRLQTVEDIVKFIYKNQSI